MAAAGSRLVAVGQRGHVLLSDDGGATWTQAAVPVSVDLTAVHFASPDRGWAVGHGGVILATRDGGRSWVKKLDVRGLAPMLERYRARRGTPAAVLRQVEILTAPGTDASLLDVWLADGRIGYAVGAFNLVLRTDDGGETWAPWLHRTDNPEGLHLYAIREIAGDLYAAGERGLVLKLDRASRRLETLRVPYAGSFFGLVADAGGAVIAYGLRGHALRSRDGGATWEALPTGVDVALTGAAVTPDGRLVLATQAGQVLVAAHGCSSFRPLSIAGSTPVSSMVVVGTAAVVLVGPAGASRARLEPALAGGFSGGG